MGPLPQIRLVTEERLGIYIERLLFEGKVLGPTEGHYREIF